MWVVLLFFGLTVAPLGVALGGWITDPDRAASTGVIITMVMPELGIVVLQVQAGVEPSRER